MDAVPRAVPLRRQVLAVIVGISTLAIVLFAVPLAVAVRQLDREEAVARLERDATRIAAAAPDDEARHPRPVQAPAGFPSGLTVGVYAIDGTRLQGDGPAASDVAADSHDGRVHQAVEHGRLAVSAPIPSDEGPEAVARVAMDYDAITDITERSWLLMGGLATLVVVLAAAAARQQSYRLARPLERLTVAAQSLGHGDFSVRASRSGVHEVDAAGQALEATALRLGDVLERERAFSADVSHQLRTPLTSLLLGMESALARPDADLRTAMRKAVERGEQLHEIIEDLLSLARDNGAAREPLDLTELLDGVRDRWRGPLAAQGRALGIEAYGPLPAAHASPAAARQILDVLIGNAAAHGLGKITVTASDVGNGLAIDVSDEGPGVPEDEDVFARRATHGEGHGIGLALARSLAEAEGGRLVLRHASPPVFSLLLPAHTG